MLIVYRVGSEPVFMRPRRASWVMPNEAVSSGHWIAVASSLPPPLAMPKLFVRMHTDTCRDHTARLEVTLSKTGSRKSGKPEEIGWISWE